MNHEPLQPLPRWVYTSGAGWHDATGQLSSARVLDPSAYVAGYEAGAYALARRLYAMLEEPDDANGEKALVRVARLLHTYETGAAHPARGWEHEPKRN